MFGTALPFGLEDFNIFLYLLASLKKELIEVSKENKGWKRRNKIGLKPIELKPIGLKLIWIKPLGLKLKGLKPIGLNAVGLKLIGFKPTGLKPIRLKVFF